MRVELHRGAEQDIARAAAFYEREGSAALAARFIAEIERVIVLLLANPGLGTPRTGGKRAFPATGFPYILIDREIARGIRVLVIKHDRRHPGHGASRR